MKNLEKMCKIECLNPCFTFAGFADLPAAKEGQFADCRRKRKLLAKRHVLVVCTYTYILVLIPLFTKRLSSKAATRA